jgi:hypothetical protein
MAKKVMPFEDAKIGDTINVGTLKNPIYMTKTRGDLNFEIWYVPEFPLTEIDISYTQAQSWIDRNKGSLPGLEADLRKQGLVNPLIVRFRKKYGDAVPLILVGGARLPTLLKIGYTKAPVVVCGEGGAKYDGAIHYRWSDPALHSLFKDGYLGLNTTGLCMARCSNRTRGEQPGPDSPMSYREKFSEGFHVERPEGAPPIKD